MTDRKFGLCKGSQESSYPRADFGDEGNFGDEEDFDPGEEDFGDKEDFVLTKETSARRSGTSAAKRTSS